MNWACFILKNRAAIHIRKIFLTLKTIWREKQTDFYIAVRNEKFLRMIRRDRSHPSLVIYNMHNERGARHRHIDKAEMHGRASAGQ